MTVQRSAWAADSERPGVTRRGVLGPLRVIAAAFLATVVCPAVVLAAPGELDSTFGSGGKQTLNFGGTDRATHVALTPNGRIVAVGATDANDVGDFAVGRLTPAGFPDLSFRFSGKLSFGTSPGVNDLGGGVVVLPNDQIVVTGQGGAGQDFVTRRLDRYGAIDGSFAGTGTSIVDFGGAETVSAMVRQPDGKLVIVGSTTSAGGGDFAIARLNADGSPDTSFSGDGKQTVDFGGADAANAVALAPDGRIVVAGQGGAASDMVVVRLNTDGTVDASLAPGAAGDAYVDFGGTDTANGVAVQPDGKIVLAGTTNAVGSGDFAVARLSAGGALDPDFSADGKLTIGYGGAGEQGLAVALQQNGRILVYGQGASDLELTRLSPDGSTDTTFGSGGTATLDFGGTEFDGDVAVQPDGGIVTAGSTNVADGADMAFTRLLGDPPTTSPPPPPTPPRPDFAVGFAGGSNPLIVVPPGETVTRQILLFRNTTSVGPVSLFVSKLRGGLKATVLPKKLTGKALKRTVGGKGRYETATLKITAKAGVAPGLSRELITTKPAATAGKAKKVPFQVLVQSQLTVWEAGIEVNQGVQTDGQPRDRVYNGVRLLRDRTTVVRTFTHLNGPRPAVAPGAAPYPPLTVALYGLDAAGHLLPGSPLYPNWSPPASGRKRNEPGLLRRERESASSADVFVLPQSWTERGPIKLLAKPFAPQPSTSSSTGRPEPLAATFCTHPSCGGQSLLLKGVSFAKPPRAQVMSVVKVTGTGIGPVVSAKSAFDDLTALSPVPFLFLNAAGYGDVYPSFTGVESTPSTRILEGTEAWDDAHHHQGDKVMGLFGIPGAGGISQSTGGRVGVGNAAGTSGPPTRPVTVVAHESLHLLGLEHADSSCGGNVPGFPTGFPDTEGRMRSVGIDTTFQSGGTAAGDPPYRIIPDDPPASPGWDLMSYCHPPIVDSVHWISARNWSALLGVPTPAARRVRAAPTGSFLVLRARESGGRIETPTVLPTTVGATPAAPSPYRLVARDASGAVVANAPVSATVAEQAAAAATVVPFTSIEGRVPAAGVARLALVRGATVVAEVTRSPAAPTARLLVPKRGARLRGNGLVTVGWQVADDDGDRPSVSLEYSANGGGTYTSVAEAEGSGKVTLPRGMLVSATHGRLRLRATDGFNTTVTAALPVVVVPRPPAVTIISPGPRQRVQGGSNLNLQGTATDDRGRVLSGRSLRWYAGKRLLGSGARVSAILPAGTRGVRLVAKDRSGRAGSATAGVRMAATTPLFVRLSAPHRLSRRARTLTLVVASTEPATLRLGKQHHAVGRRARRVHVRVRRGRSTLRLRFVLATGRRSSTQYVLVPRR